MDARSRYKARTSAAGVGTNVSGITGPIRDVKAEAESFERNIAPQVKQQVVDTFNRQQRDSNPQYTNQKDTYTSPQNTYASDLNFLNVDPETIEDLGLFDKIGDDYALSDEVLAFYGVDPNNPGYIPQELYQMIAEGSIVTPMEAMQSNESNIGTYTDLEMGNHPLLGGLGKYYKIMGGQAFPGAGTGGSGGEKINTGGGGDYGAGIAAGLGRRPKQLGDEEGIPKGLRLLQYMVNLHKENPYTKMALRKKSGGIVNLVGG